MTREERDWIRREVDRCKREKLSKDPQQTRGVFNGEVLKSDSGEHEATYVRCMTPDLIPTRQHRGYEAALRELQGGKDKHRLDWLMG